MIGEPPSSAGGDQTAVTEASPAVTAGASGVPGLVPVAATTVDGRPDGRGAAPAEGASAGVPAITNPTKSADNITKRALCTGTP